MDALMGSGHPTCQNQWALTSAKHSYAGKAPKTTPEFPFPGFEENPQQPKATALLPQHPAKARAEGVELA